MEKQRTTRITFADIARGLAVIYFMWCHTLNIHEPYIDTWAMPVFFVVMGIFFKPTVTWREMIVKKVNTILVPLFLLSIPSYIEYIVSIPLKEFVIRFFNPFACVHGVGWFLLCMFWCYIIYYAIIRLTKYNRIWTVFICVVLSVISFYASTQRIMGYRIILPMFISTSLTVLPFICVGDMLQEEIKRQRSKWVDFSAAFTLAAGTLGGIFLLQFHGGEFIENWYYEQLYVSYMALSLIGTASILYICKLLPSFMSYAGEHSLLLLMIHPYIIRILRLFGLTGIEFFVVTLIISLVLIGLLSRYLPILEGKKKIFK